MGTIISQGSNFVVDKDKNELIIVRNIFCFDIVSHQLLERGLIISQDSYEFTKTKISLSYLRPDSTLTIYDSEFLSLI